MLTPAQLLFIVDQIHLARIVYSKSTINTGATKQIPLKPVELSLASFVYEIKNLNMVPVLKAQNASFQLCW